MAGERGDVGAFLGLTLPVPERGHPGAALVGGVFLPLHAGVVGFMFLAVDLKRAHRHAVIGHEDHQGVLQSLPLL